MQQLLGVPRAYERPSAAQQPGGTAQQAGTTQHTHADSSKAAYCQSIASQLPVDCQSIAVQPQVTPQGRSKRHHVSWSLY
jgi:hypothetical protein